MASRVCLGVVALLKSGIRVAGGPALLRRTGKAKPPAPAAPLSAPLRLCWGMLGASLQPTEGAGFGLDFVVFFLFLCKSILHSKFYILPGQKLSWSKIKISEN